MILIIIKNRFRSYFGFDAPYGRRFEKIRRVLQIFVDNMLHDYALEFQKNCESEERTLWEKFKDPETAASSMRESVERVRLTKKNFWGAYDSARIFGFEMKPSFKDYLAEKGD